jgi:hypothetical protein
LKGLSAGTYILEARNETYNNLILTEIKLKENENLVLNIPLDKVVLEFGPVTVKAKVNRESTTEILRLQRNSATVVDGITSETFKKTPDSKASDVLKRISGASVQDNKFVVVRGLSDRYNFALINGAPLPSSESDRKAFSFDVFPSNMLDNLVIIKTATPDLPGEFAGGVVKIFTKAIPENNFLTIDISSAYREGTTGSAFFATKNSNLAWTGFNQGYFDLPNSFPASRTDLLNAGPAGIDAIGASLKNNWLPVESSALPDMRASLSGGFKFDLGSTKLGNVTALNYSNTRSNFQMVRNDWGFSNIGVTGQPDAVFNFLDQQYTNAIRVGVSNNWSARFSNGSVIEFKNLFNQLANTQYIKRDGFDNGANWDIRSFDQVYRGIYTGQLTGRHDLQSGSLKVDWMVGYNAAYRAQPDYKRFRYNVDGASASLFIPNGAAQTTVLGRTYIDMNESSYTAAFNAVKKIDLKDSKELELKFGAFFEDKVRDFNARNIGYVKSTPTFQTTLPIDQLLSPQNFNSRTGIRVDEQTNPNDSYDASNQLIAGYLSANYALGKKFNVIAGVRAEQNSQKLNSADLVGKPIKYDNTRLDLLPSVNITYNFTEKSLLRLAYGKTLNRPEFRELAPFSFYDFVNNRTVSGNPALKNADINNFDFRYEFYITVSSN